MKLKSPACTNLSGVAPSAVHAFLPEKTVMRPPRPRFHCEQVRARAGVFGGCAARDWPPVRSINRAGSGRVQGRAVSVRGVFDFWGGLREIAGIEKGFERVVWNFQRINLWRLVSALLMVLRKNFWDKSWAENYCLFSGAIFNRNLVGKSEVSPSER